MDGALCIYVFNLYHLTLFGMPSLLLYALFFKVMHGILVHHDYCSPGDLDLLCSVCQMHGSYFNQGVHDNLIVFLQRVNQPPSAQLLPWVLHTMLYQW